MMKYLKTVFITAFSMAVIFSCYKSKLNEPALGVLSAQAIANKKGVDGLLIGAYSMLDGVANPGSPGFVYAAGTSNWIFGSICGSEAYKGSNGDDQSGITDIGNFAAGATSDYFEQKWAAVYEGVQRANTVLIIMRQAKDMTTADTIEVKAEALFLRAFYHFEAKKLWNKIPFVDESVTYDAGNYHIVNSATWVYIENDLIYAMNNLPPVQGNAAQGYAVGRANKYAAEAFLAKAYMFELKYAQAKPLLADLIANGVTSNGLKYSLNNLYSDNFNIATKNSAESVFACQSSVNDGSGGNNGDVGDVLNFPVNSPVTGCCGFFPPSQYLVNHFKTDAVTGLPDLYNFNIKDVKNDDTLLSIGPFTPYTGTLDPRLDWTVGRAGIPYLDWGKDPGNGWIRAPAFFGPYVPKKNVYYKAQEATYSDSWNQETAMNINLVRFADILLWAAETEVKIGTLNQAEAYVNMIRARAANPAGFVHTYIDDAHPENGFTNNPAANYFIKTYPPGYFAAQGPAYALKAVQYERMLELGMEGHRFFDLVRWGIAATEINAYFLKEKKTRSILNNAVFTPNKNEYFPIPQTELDLSAGADGIRKMTQNPGY